MHFLQPLIVINHVERGRPTKHKAKEIKNNIISLRVSGLSAKYIVAKTGYNRDTVYKHIREFEESSKKDDLYDKKISNIVSHAITSFDHRLQKATEFESEIDKEIKKQNSPKHLLSLKANISKHIMDILDKRFSYAIQVVADEFENKGEK